MLGTQGVGSFDQPKHVLGTQGVGSFEHPKHVLGTQGGVLLISQNMC